MVKKTVLVTGVNGFIGSNVAQLYLGRGYDVIGVDLALVSLVEGVIYYQLNLLSDDINAILLKYKPYAVIHCAGMADVNYSIKHPESDFYQNVVISRKILYSLKENSEKTRFVFLSSASVYGNPIDLPIKEEVHRTPISPYALHKKLVEEICQYFIAQYGMDIKILRIFSAYGNGLKKQIFWDMAQKIRTTGRLELFGTGNETRDFIHINDLVKAIFLIANSEEKKEVIYNVANGEEISIKNVAQIFCQVLELDYNIIQFNRQQRIGNPNNWCANIEKLRELGYRQEVSIEDGIKAYVGWLKTEKYI